MPDSQSDSRKQAITYIDDKPHFELNAEEWIFPILSRDDQFKLYFHVRPYEPYAVKKWYDRVIPTRRRITTSQTSIQMPDYAEARKFVMDHFLGLSGVAGADGEPPSITEQREWLEENSPFQIRLWRDGFDAAAPRVQQSDAPGKPVLIFGRTDTLIRSELTLYSKERDCDERITLAHTLTRMSEKDRHDYDKATQLIENTRSNELTTEGNWDVIEGMYNRSVKHLEGAVINGVPANEENREGREGWARLVPFCQKIYVMAEMYREVELKNA